MYVLCMYIYIHTYIYTYVCICICMYIYMYIHIDMYVYAERILHTNTFYRCMYTHVHIHNRGVVEGLLGEELIQHMYSRTLQHMCMCIHTFVYIHIASCHTATQRQWPRKNATSLPLNEFVGCKAEEAASSSSLPRNEFVDLRNLKPQQASALPQVHTIYIYMIIIIIILYYSQDVCLLSSTCILLHRCVSLVLHMFILAR